MNPFAGAGREITGSRLVGRERELRRLTARAFQGAGNMSIVGMPRIGKTSLVAEAIRRHRDVDRDGAPSVVKINLGTIDASRDLFVTLSRDVVDLHGDAMPSRLCERVEQPSADTQEAYQLCSRLLRAMRRAGRQSVVVLDEFDAIRGRAFERPEQTIQQLRELLYAPSEYGLHGVLISRRSLPSIENQTQNSVLGGICESMYLGPLDLPGLETMQDRARAAVPGFAPRVDLWYWTGGHPFLAESLLCHLVEQPQVDEVPSDVQLRCYEHYTHLEAILAEEDLFDQLLQLTVGPRWSLRQGSAERLRSYGLVAAGAGDGRLQAWSGHFQLFLEMRARHEGFWATWRETEQQLRDLIDDSLREAHGDGWLDVLCRRYPKQLEATVAGWRQTQAKELRAFGEAGTDRLLDYSYPMELWTVISLEWAALSKTFKRDKAYWNARFETISKVRNPSAHSREQYLPDALLNQARGYCQEILDVVGAHYSTPKT